MFIHSLRASLWALINALNLFSFFFSQTKQCLNVSPSVAAIQSTQTLARRQSSAGRSPRSIQFACQTNLTGVPSQGQRWECIKTVKMATVTGSWHSLHLGMMSTFDIPPPCPKIIIPQLNSIARLLQPLVMNILHHPPTSFSIYTWLSSLSLLLSVWLFVHLPTFLFILSFSSAHHPSSYPLLLLLLHPVILFLSTSLRCNQPSLLFLAESGLFSCSHNSGIIYLLFTHSLFPFTSSLPNLSVCMSALSPHCQLIPAIYSIKCFCISVAAFLFYSPMSICFSSRLSLCPPSILSPMLDKARE